MLEFTLTLNQITFAPGEPITGLVRLRNMDGEPATVNGRLALNTPYAPQGMREIAFRLTDPSGTPLEFQAKVNVGAPRDNHFKTLGPGEALERSYDLAQYYDFGQPGTYSVQAVYQNLSEPEAGHGPAVWQGEIESLPTTFTVLASGQR